MKFIQKFQYAILACILVLGFLLRSNNLYTWPRFGATFDEYAWTWQGISLIQSHVPTSWSPHPQYTHFKDITYQHTHFRLVTPYLEHPPVFGLIVGAYALFSGVKDMYHVDLQHIRGLALLLGMISIGTVYLLSRQIYGIGIGLLSTFFYSIIPSVVIGSRIVENENFFIPVFLFCLFLIAKYIQTKKRWLFVLAAILCGLLTLAKVPWASATIGIMFILLFLKRYKDATIFLAIVLPIFALFFLYGMYFDRALFFNLWGLQLNRYDITFNSFFALFTYPILVDRQLIDGWIYFGWFGMFLLLARDPRKHIYILLPFLAYFIVFVYAIPNEAEHGWYRYPFYPFFAIALGVFIKEYFNKNYLLTCMFLIFTGLSMFQASWAQALGFSFLVFRFFIIFSMAGTVPLFYPKLKGLSNVGNLASLCIVSLLTIWTIFSYNEQ